MPLKIGRDPELSALSRAIDPEWIAQALARTGKASIRKRKLPAEQVIWLVIALALYRHQSIPEVVAHLDLSLPDESNPDIAKKRLDPGPAALGARTFGPIVWDECNLLG